MIEISSSQILSQTQLCQSAKYDIEIRLRHFIGGLRKKNSQFYHDVFALSKDYRLNLPSILIYSEFYIDHKSNTRFEEELKYLCHLLL